MSPVTSYWLSVYVHLVSLVLVVGLALFWTIMAVSLRGFGQAETGRLLQLLNRSRWPHVVVPKAVRLPLPLVGLILIAAVALSGTAAAYVHGTPGNWAWSFKMALFVVLIVVQIFLMRRPNRVLIYVNLALVLSIVVISGLMLR